MNPIALTLVPIVVLVIVFLLALYKGRPIKYCEHCGRLLEVGKRNGGYNPYTGNLILKSIVYCSNCQTNLGLWRGK